MRKALILSAVMFAIGCSGSDNSSSSSSGSTGTTAGTTTNAGTTTGGNTTGNTTTTGGNTTGSSSGNDMSISGVVTATSQSTPTAQARAVGSVTQVTITGIMGGSDTVEINSQLNTGSIASQTYTNSDFAMFSASILVGGTQLSATGASSDTYSLTVNSVTTANGVSIIHGSGTFVVDVSGTYSDGGAASGTETINTGF